MIFKKKEKIFCENCIYHTMKGFSFEHYCKKEELMIKTKQKNSPISKGAILYRLSHCIKNNKRNNCKYFQQK